MSPRIWRELLAAGFAVSVMVCPAPALAGLTSPTCTAVVPTLAFGNYNPLSGSVVRINTTISITCTQTLLGGTVNYTIALNKGNTGSYAARKLRSGVNSLNYNLYTDGTYSAVWGNGTGGSVTVAGSGNLALLGGRFTNTATVYGQIPAGQTTVVPGVYNDTITVTLTY